MHAASRPRVPVRVDALDYDADCDKDSHWLCIAVQIGCYTDVFIHAYALGNGQYACLEIRHRVWLRVGELDAQRERIRFVVVVVYTVTVDDGLGDGVAHAAAVAVDDGVAIALRECEPLALDVSVGHAQPARVAFSRRVSFNLR